MPPCPLWCAAGIAFDDRNGPRHLIAPWMLSPLRPCEKQAGGRMRHEWIFDVLSDLRAYADKNGLNGLVAAVDEAMQVARAEVHDGADRRDGLPPGGRAH